MHIDVLELNSGVLSIGLLLFCMRFSRMIVRSQDPVSEKLLQDYITFTFSSKFYIHIICTQSTEHLSIRRPHSLTQCGGGIISGMSMFQSRVGRVGDDRSQPPSGLSGCYASAHQLNPITHLQSWLNSFIERNTVTHALIHTARLLSRYISAYHKTLLCWSVR